MQSGQSVLGRGDFTKVQPARPHRNVLRLPITISSMTNRVPSISTLCLLDTIANGTTAWSPIASGAASNLWCLHILPHTSTAGASLATLRLPQATRAGGPPVTRAEANSSATLTQPMAATTATPAWQPATVPTTVAISQSPSPVMAVIAAPPLATFTTAQHSLF